MKYIKISKVDGSIKEVTLTDVIDKTEGCGYWKKGTVEEMLANGLDVCTPFAIYKAEQSTMENFWAFK